MPPSLSDQQVAELARQQATLDVSDEQVMHMAQQQATQDVLGQGPPQAQEQPGPDFNKQFIRPAILPTGLGIAGNVLGRSGGPLVSNLLGAGGSMIGEGINQLTGITEPSLKNIALAGAVPLGASAITGLASKALPFVTPGKVAQALNLVGPEAAAAEVGKLSPKISSSALFKMATETNAKIPMNRTIHAIDAMLDEVQDVSKGVASVNAQSTQYLKGLKNLLSTNPQGITPIALQRELEGVGSVKASLKAKAGSGLGRIEKVYSQMIKDLDDAVNMSNAAQPGARALVAARDTWKREKVIEEIGDEITNATKYMRGQGESVQFNPAAVLNKLRKNEFYESALTAKERGEIEGILKTINNIPVLQPGAGQHYGSGRFWKSLGTGAAGATAGGGIGFAMGGKDDAAIGAGLGAGSAMIPPIASLGSNFKTALVMGSGRALIRELLNQSKGSITPQVASVVAAYAEAVRAGQVND